MNRFSTKKRYIYKSCKKGLLLSHKTGRYNSEVLQLQDEICKMTEKYANSPRSRENYAVDDFFEEKEILKYEESEFKEREDLHITLGKADIKKHVDKVAFPTATIFDTLAIGHMGNYGSVRDIRYSKELK